MQTDRQNQIIEAGLELISAKGIQGLTIKNLSKEIGISEPAIYRHFENKIEILTTILELLKNNSNKLFEDEIKTSGTAIEKIEHLFASHFKTFEKMPSLASVIFSEELFRNEATLIKKISEIIDHNNQILVSIVKEGQKNGEIRKDINAEKLVIMVMGTLRLFIKKWQFSGMPFSLTKEGKEISQMIRLLLEQK